MKYRSIFGIVMSAVLMAGMLTPAVAAADREAAAGAEGFSDPSSLEGAMLPEEDTEADRDSEAVVVYATGDESATGDGKSVAAPQKLSQVLKDAVPGEEIHLLPGSYICENIYKIQVSGTEAAPITLIADGATLDFSAHPSHEALSADDDKYPKQHGVTLSGSYWHIEGLRIVNAPGLGLHIEGSCNEVRDSEFAHNRDSGLQISGSPDGKYENWAHDNHIINCTSHHNYDDFRPKYGEDADGFAAKVQLGEGNSFDGCIAYCNSDDGWDLFAKDDIYPDAPCTITNCIAFSNGYVDGDNHSPCGDGNGFKLGSADWAVPNRIMNCISFCNMAHGFTDNNNTAPIEVVGCTAYNNNLGSMRTQEQIRINSENSNLKTDAIIKKRNFQFNLEKGGETSGVLSVYSSDYIERQKCDKDSGGRYTDNFNGTIENSVLYIDGSYKVGEKTEITAGNPVGTKLDAEPDEGIFTSVELPDFTDEAVDYDSLWRDEEGYLKLGGLFEVKDESYSSAGAVLASGKSDYRYFETAPKSSSDYNTVEKVKANLAEKNIVFSSYEVNGGKFSAETADKFTGPENQFFTVMIKSTMTLQNSDGEEALYMLEDSEGNAYVPFKRLKTTRDPEVEENKIVGSAIAFKTEDIATVTVHAMTGDSGKITIFNEDGSVYDETQIYPLQTKTIKAYVFSIYEAGTYYIGTQDTGNGFIYAVDQVDGSVAKEKAGEVERHELTAAMAIEAKKADGSSDELSFDNGYFKLVGATSAQEKSSTLELKKAGGSYIEFTTGAESDVTITAASTGSSNESEALLESGGAAVAEDEGLTAVKGTSGTTLYYSGLAAGTYKFYTPGTSRGIRFISLAVLEKVDKKDGGSSSEKDDGSSSVKDDGSSSAKDDSSSSVKDDDSSSVKDDDSSSVRDDGSSSVKDDGSSSDKDGSSGSSKDDGSSSAKGDSSSSAKDSGAGNKDATPEKELAIKAVSENKASTLPDELQVIPEVNGKKNVYTASFKGAVSDNSGALSGTLTMAKGDKVRLAGYSKATAKLVKDTTKSVAVNGKGILTAKKATPDNAPAGISYTADDGRLVYLKIVVMEPSVTKGNMSGEAGEPLIKKLNVQVKAGADFDLVLKAPLTAKADAAKVKEKPAAGWGLTSGYFTVNEKGQLHISGKAPSKGTAKIPFSAYGKKYTLKLTAK